MPREALMEVTLTRHFDRQLKAKIYAEARVPEYWVVDVVRRLFWRHRSPQGQTYQEVREYRSGESIAPDALRNVCSRSTNSCRDAAAQ